MSIESPLENVAAGTLATGKNKFSVRSNDAKLFGGASHFLAVTNAEGVQVGWWSTEICKTVQGAQALITGLREAVEATVTADDLYGKEFEWALNKGCLRVAADASYIRFVTSRGTATEVYWTAEDFTVNCKLTVGAIFGLLEMLSS